MSGKESSGDSSEKFFVYDPVLKRKREVTFQEAINLSKLDAQKEKTKKRGSSESKYLSESESSRPPKKILKDSKDKKVKKALDGFMKFMEEMKSQFSSSSPEIEANSDSVNSIGIRVEEKEVPLQQI